MRAGFQPRLGGKVTRAKVGTEKNHNDHTLKLKTVYMITVYI